MVQNFLVLLYNLRTNYSPNLLLAQYLLSVYVLYSIPRGCSCTLCYAWICTYYVLLYLLPVLSVCLSVCLYTPGGPLRRALVSTWPTCMYYCVLSVVNYLCIVTTNYGY